MRAHATLLKSTTAIDTCNRRGSFTLVEREGRLKPELQRSSRNRRRGFSLIELVTVISILGIVLSLSGMTFHLLLRSEKGVSQSFVTERAISRLAVQFRDDVHQSESAAVVDETVNSSTELTLSDAAGVRIRYAVTKLGLARLLYDGDRIVSREDYRLPDCHVRFMTGGESDSRLLTLVIDRPSATPTKNARSPRPPRALEMQAHLKKRNTVAQVSGGVPVGVPPSGCLRIWIGEIKIEKTG